MRRFIALLTIALLIPLSARGEAVGSSARSAVIIDAKSGRILLHHHADEPLPMASTTKVMTALLAIELGDLASPVTAGHNAYGVPGTSIYLSEGETLSLHDMLYGLMLASGNDAAVAIAEHIGGTVEDFCALMTAKAAELGCTNTQFLTPHGLPCEGHYTTASDLAKIAREAMTKPFFREIVGTTRATIPWENRGYDRVLNNKNRYLTSCEGATGIKTGYTKKAGRCLVFGAAREGMEIIGVVLNCPDWFDEAQRLTELAFEKYEGITMLHQGERIGTVAVTTSQAGAVEVMLAEDLAGVIPKGSTPLVEVDLPETLDAPIDAGQPLGTARLMAGGLCVAEATLVAAEDVARDDWPARWEMYWGNWLVAE